MTVNKKELARKFAFIAHKGQYYGSERYTVHLEQVVKVLREAQHLAFPGHIFEATVKAMNEAIVIAWLHDVVEDTEYTIKDIIDIFGMDTALQVDSITDPIGSNRESRKRDLCRNMKVLKQLHDMGLACMVKLADRIANVRACKSDRGAQNFF